MNTTIRRILVTCATTVGLVAATVEQASAGIIFANQSGRNVLTRVWRVKRRGVTRLLALSITLLALLLPVDAANATKRLPNGAYGNYGLDCGYRSAQLTVQGGANGTPVQGFKFWVYSVDYGVYLARGLWVPMGVGWQTVTRNFTQYPGRYQVYVKYYSYTGGRWYAAGEWAWARNAAGKSSLICTVS